MNEQDIEQHLAKVAIRFTHRGMYWLVGTETPAIRLGTIETERGLVAEVRDAITHGAYWGVAETESWQGWRTLRVQPELSFDSKR
jgi:hypothetical protein